VQAQAEADVIATRGEALRKNPVVLDARLIEAYDNGTVFVTGQSGQQVILDAADAEQNGNQSTSESGSPSGSS